MFRFLDISINGAEVSLPLDFFVYAFSWAILLLTLIKGMPKASISKLLVLTLLSSVFAMWGGRFLYHGIVDHRFSLEAGGQTYYGALFAQSTIFYFLTRVLISENQQRTRAIDLFAVASPFIYSVLRTGCFANGCCYGKLCRYPWAVVFKDERSLTPLLGLPLHPTQLYAVIHGLLAGGILVLLYRKRGVLQLEGRLYFLMMVLLGIGRIVIEPFRADLKPSLWLGMGMNQWLSGMVILLGACFLLKPQVRKRGSAIFTSQKTVTALFIVALNLPSTGCGLTPRSPSLSVVTETTTLSSGIYVHRMARESDSNPKNNRNLLFIAVDDAPEDLKVYEPALSKLYKTDQPPRMEEVLWWHYSKQFAKLYREVVRIQYDTFDWDALTTALKHLESSQIPYDIFLLTHGIPNYLISSKKHLPISWKNFQVFSGENRLHFLNAVFLQSCFGNSLAGDFKNSGAKSIISFQGIHNNIFFFDIFLKKYIKNNGEEKFAFQSATTSFQKKITHNLVYRYLIENLLKISPHDYAGEILENNWMPALLE